MSWVVELCDVTPSRATVTAVHDADHRPRSRYWAEGVSDELRPDVGERVWVLRSPLDSRGPVTITGRGPAVQS